MDYSLNIKPFKEFWINCRFNMIFSILSSLEPSYKMAAYINDYNYYVLENETPNNTKYNSLRLKSSFNFNEKFLTKLIIGQKEINLYDGNCLNLNIIKEKILNNEIVLVGVDLFYWIPNSVCWEKHHWEHYSFVSGFNDEKEVFYVFDENFKGYDMFEIPKDRFLKAVQNSPLKPHAYSINLSQNIGKFNFSINDIANNARFIIDELIKIKDLNNLWKLSDKDFNEGHMCDFISTQIFQIINRHIANQFLFEELNNNCANPLINHSLIKYSIELQKGWTLIKHLFVKTYHSDDKKSLINDVNEKCKLLFSKEIDMWELFLKNAAEYK